MSLRPPSAMRLGSHVSRRRRRGQAMVEYSIVTWALLVALMVGTTVKIAPAPGGVGPRQNLIQLFLGAYRAYYDSYYFVLQLPFP